MGIEMLKQMNISSSEMSITENAFHRSRKKKRKREEPIFGDIEPAEKGNHSGVQMEAGVEYTTHSYGLLGELGVSVQSDSNNGEMGGLGGATGNDGNTGGGIAQLASQVVEKAQPGIREITNKILLTN